MSAAPIRWPELERLVSAVADERGHLVTSIMGRARTKSVAAARADFCQRAHELGYSWPEIGAFLHRHHTTVMVTDGRKKKVRVAA